MIWKRGDKCGTRGLLMQRKLLLLAQNPLELGTNDRRELFKLYSG
jgi:hypothetical protein